MFTLGKISKTGIFIKRNFYTRNCVPATSIEFTFDF